MTAALAVSIVMVLGGASGATAAEKLEFASSEANDSYYYPKVCSVRVVSDAASALIVQCPPGHGFEKFKFAYTSMNYDFRGVDGIVECGIPADGTPHTYTVAILPDADLDYNMTRYEIVPLYAESMPTCPSF